MEFRCVEAELVDVRIWITRDELHASVPHSVVLHCTRAFSMHYTSERDAWSVDSVLGQYSPVVHVFSASYRGALSMDAAADLSLNILNYLVPPAPGDYAYPAYVGRCSRVAGAWHLPFMREVVRPLTRCGGVLAPKAIVSWATRAAPSLLAGMQERGQVRRPAADTPR